VDPLVEQVVANELRGSGPGRRVPAQDIRASYQRKLGKPLPSGFVAGEEERGLESDLAVTRGANALYDSRQKEQMAVESRILDEEKALDQKRTERARIDEQLAHASYAVRERQMDAENAKDFDADRYFKRNTGARVLGAIAVALGEFGRALTGSNTNIAKEILDDAINRDILEQKEEYARARDSLGDARNAYADLIAVHGSPQRAEEELRLRMEAIADKRLALAAHKTGSEEIIANATMQLAQNREERAMRWLQLEQSTQADVVENYQHRPAHTLGGGGGSLLKSLKAGAEAAKALDDIRGGGSKLPPQVQEKQYGRVVIHEGQKFYAPDAARAKEYQGVVDVFPQLRHNIQRQREIIAAGPQSLTPGDRAELQAITQRNKMLMKQLETLGAITASDQELVSPLVGEDSERFWKLDSSTARTLDAAEEHARMRLNAAQRNMFHEPELNTPLAAPPPASVR
jgi:hypothetical protein